MLQASSLESQDIAKLLQSVAEQLKTPLSVIARQAELAQLTQDVRNLDPGMLQTQASAAMRLVDCYLLGLQLLRQQTTLVLEPVSVSSTLVDVAHELSGPAKQYDIALDVHVAGRYEPVMAHRTGLRAALLALGYALLEHQPSEDARQRITLAVHRTPKGIVTGLYSNSKDLSADVWHRALTLQDTAARPLAPLTGNGAGLFVADTIMQAMSTRLRVGRHQKQQGLVATLVPSQQLSLV